MVHVKSLCSPSYIDISIGTLGVIITPTRAASINLEKLTDFVSVERDKSSDCSECASVGYGPGLTSQLLVQYNVKIYITKRDIQDTGIIKSSTRDVQEMYTV